MFFYKFVPAFPDLADAVYTFLPGRECLAIPFVKFMAVIALDDEVNLRLIDFFIFPFLGPCHTNKHLRFSDLKLSPLIKHSKKRLESAEFHPLI
jgi:hypothetical protein